MKRCLQTVLVLLIIFPGLISAQVPHEDAEKKITISGYVTDKTTGEHLAGVTVYESRSKSGTVTNENGFFTLTIIQGNYELQFSFIGYAGEKRSGTAQKNFTLNIELIPSDTELGEVVVEARRESEDIRAATMSVVDLDARTIKAVPSLLGEIDLIKVIQLMPGVQPTSEGSSGFSVRGGNADQNLIILDDAVIYNASHLMGFFSVFNNDAVRSVTLYKGDIPASYGGRLSSLLDVEMKEGSSKGLAFNGSVGTVSSKLTLETPVFNENTTLLVAGRRTYADLFLPLAKEEEVRDNRLYFYDLNAKISHKLNDRNRLWFTLYRGRDIFKNDYSSVSFGNDAGALRWNHILSGKMYFNLSLTGSSYSYKLASPDNGSGSFSWVSHVNELGARFDIVHSVSDNHRLKYGVQTAFHRLLPGTITGTGFGSGFTEFRLPGSDALESAVYFSDDFRIGEKITLKYGLRGSLFQNIGAATVYNYDADHRPADSTVYGKGEFYNSYFRVEPRIALTVPAGESSSVKTSYSRTVQYLSLAQNSAAGTPLDIWFTAGRNVKPQVCDQVAAGYFRNINGGKIAISGELYYKSISDLIDFRDHASLFLNQYLDGELRTGKGYSYGIETMVRKDEGRISGWLSYTWARSYRKVSDINSGLRYVSPYDKPHNVNIVLNYEINGRLSASATWVYATGLPVTLPTGKAILSSSVIPVYTSRNSYRMEDYHRLDLSLTLRDREKKGRRFHSEFNLSVYNVYNRHNAWAINFERDADNDNMIYAEKTYLFSIIPALTYSMRFR